MGLLPEERWTSEAFCSNIKLKKASIFAIILNIVPSGRLIAKFAPYYKPLSGVASKITEEITELGAISFARFMEMALYCPVYGYYEREEDTIWRGGDYYTSVSVGCLFGELMAFQFAEWLGGEAWLDDRGSLSASRAAEAVEIVEAGAHRGELARDILGWIRRQRPV